MSNHNFVRPVPSEVRVGVDDRVLIVSSGYELTMTTNGRLYVIDSVQESNLLDLLLWREMVTEAEAMNAKIDALDRFVNEERDLSAYFTKRAQLSAQMAIKHDDNVVDSLNERRALTGE